jgi:hypothetical protein
MAAALALALPASFLGAAGWAGAIRRAFVANDLGRRLGWSLVAVLPPLFLASLCNALLEYPFWSGTKASYGLLLTPSLGLFGALGLAALDGVLRRAPPLLRALPFAFMTALGAAIACAYLA